MAVNQDDKTELFAKFSRGLATRLVDWFNEIDSGTLSTSNLSLSGTLDVTGAATIAGGLDASLGTTTLGATTVNGMATFNATPNFETGIAIGSGSVTLSDAVNIVVNTNTGTKIGTDTTQKIGFFNKAPVAQQAALTAAHATLTQAGTDSGDVAIQAITSTSPFGFANAAEGEAVVACVLNAMARLAQIETALENLGLIAAN